MNLRLIIIGSLLVLLLIICNRKFSIIARIKQSRTFNIFLGRLMSRFIQSFLGACIHKVAVKGYKKEASHLINIYSKIDKEELADYLVMSVWTRAGMQIEGHFEFPDGQKDLSPDISYYMGFQFEKIVNGFKKRGLIQEAVAMSIWVHTVRGLLYNSEMGEEFNRLWQLLMTTSNLWDKHLDGFYYEDKNKLNPKKLNDTMVLAKEILKNLPPKRSYESQSTKKVTDKKSEQKEAQSIVGEYSNSPEKNEKDKSALNDRMIAQNGEGGYGKACPRCGQTNPLDAFRCRNEDCLDILPQDNQTSKQGAREYSNITLRALWAYTKAASLEKNMFSQALQVLEKIKSESENSKLELTLEQKELLLKEVAALSVFWLTHFIWTYGVKDEKEAKEANALLFFWFKQKYHVDFDKYLEGYTKAAGTSEEVQIFGKNVAKIFDCYGAIEILELNMSIMEYFKEAIKNAKDAFTLPISEIKKDIFIDGKYPY